MLGGPLSGKAFPLRGGPLLDSLYNTFRKNAGIFPGKNTSFLPFCWMGGVLAEQEEGVGFADDEVMGDTSEEKALYGALSLGSEDEEVGFCFFHSVVDDGDGFPFEDSAFALEFAEFVETLQGGVVEVR